MVKTRDCLSEQSDALNQVANIGKCSFGKHFIQSVFPKFFDINKECDFKYLQAIKKIIKEITHEYIILDLNWCFYRLELPTTMVG